MSVHAPKAETSDAGMSSSEESLKSMFDSAMKAFEALEEGKEPTNSDTVQIALKSTIAKLEKCTNLVSATNMFSVHESVEELSTESLPYLLLPALLGHLTLKLCGRQRTDIINVAEIYFKDFLQRCKDYELTNVEIPQTDPDEAKIDSRCRTEQSKIAEMVMTREAKIKRYKIEKALKEKLCNLSKVINMPRIDEGTRREYFRTLIQMHIERALDELSSIEQERPILEYMEKHGELKSKQPDRRAPPPLRPIIIARDAAQKAVFGAGYPSLPTMTIEEFYDNRVREGLFPGSCTTIPHATLQSADPDPDEADQIKKETEADTDDPEALARARAMDEYKDDHRRGWGNRHNRS